MMSIFQLGKAVRLLTLLCTCNALACDKEDAANKDLGRVETRDDESTDPSEGGAGEAEEPVDAGPNEDAATSAQCGFVPLGLWVLCENEEFSSIVPMLEATSLQDCVDACLAEEQCTAVQDFFWLGVEGLTCNLYVGACDAPAPDPFAEFGGTREYKKVCEDPLPESAITEFPEVTGSVVDPDSGCYFTLDETGCNPVAPDDERSGGNNLDECLIACQADENCHGVKTAYGGDCSLQLSPCEPAEEFVSEFYFMLKHCDG